MARFEYSVKWDGNTLVGLNTALQKGLETASSGQVREGVVKEFNVRKVTQGYRVKVVVETE